MCRVCSHARSTLPVAVLNALFNCLREAHSRSDVKAIVVTGTKGKFSAGFDINEFAKTSGGGGIDSRCGYSLHSHARLRFSGMHAAAVTPSCSACTPSAANCSDKQPCPCRINDNFCALLESGPKPTVAAVDSLALGGGLEVALACNARLCTPGVMRSRPWPCWSAFRFLQTIYLCYTSFTCA